MINLNVSDEQVKFGSAAGDVLDLRMFASVASQACTVYDRTLRAQPVRVG